MRMNVLVLTLACACAPVLVAAQATTGSISGTATDESSAILPGVAITVTNILSLIHI